MKEKQLGYASNIKQKNKKIKRKIVIKKTHMLQIYIYNICTFYFRFSHILLFYCLNILKPRRRFSRQKQKNGLGGGGLSRLDISDLHTVTARFIIFNLYGTAFSHSYHFKKSAQHYFYFTRASVAQFARNSLKNKHILVVSLKTPFGRGR